MFFESEEKSLRSAACSLPGFIRQLRKQLCHRFFQDRMTQIRVRSFSHRLQYEIPQMRLPHAARSEYPSQVASWSSEQKIPDPASAVPSRSIALCALPARSHASGSSSSCGSSSVRRRRHAFREIRLLHTAVRLCNQIGRNLFHLASRKRIQCQHCPVQISLAAPIFEPSAMYAVCQNRVIFTDPVSSGSPDRRPRLFRFQCRRPRSAGTAAESLRQAPPLPPRSVYACAPSSTP